MSKIRAAAAARSQPAEVARAQPDGHTILLGSTSTMVLNPMTMAKVPYDPAKDFVPIGILAVSTTSIVVHASVPVKSFKELIAYARANSGKLSYGSAGSGTMSNLSGELFKNTESRRVARFTKHADIIGHVFRYRSVGAKLSAARRVRLPSTIFGGRRRSCARPASCRRP